MLSMTLRSGPPLPPARTRAATGCACPRAPEPGRAFERRVRQVLQVTQGCCPLRPSRQGRDTRANRHGPTGCPASARTVADGEHGPPRSVPIWLHGPHRSGSGTGTAAPLAAPPTVEQKRGHSGVAAGGARALEPGAEWAKLECFALNLIDLIGSAGGWQGSSACYRRRRHSGARTATSADRLQWPC